MKAKNYLLIIMLSFLLGCSIPANSKKSTPNETVMVEGMKITATNIAGTITIEAGEGFSRSYTWDGATRTVNLIPRSKRWGGRFGIYCAGRCNWNPHNRIDRGHLEENQWHS